MKQLSVYPLPTHLALHAGISDDSVSTPNSPAEDYRNSTTRPKVDTAAWRSLNISPANIPTMSSHECRTISLRILEGPRPAWYEIFEVYPLSLRKFATECFSVSLFFQAPTLDRKRPRYSHPLPSRTVISGGITVGNSSRNFTIPISIRVYLLGSPVYRAHPRELITSLRLVFLADTDRIDPEATVSFGK